MAANARNRIEVVECRLDRLQPRDGTADTRCFTVLCRGRARRLQRLTNVEPSTWRLRVGDYRIRFRFETENDGEIERILIQRVLHRREAYR